MQFIKLQATYIYIISFSLMICTFAWNIVSYQFHSITLLAVAYGHTVLFVET